jgi:hypothetical protein
MDDLRDTVARMAMEMFERTLLAVHGPEPAAVAEWSQYVVDSNAAQLAGVLVVVDRSYPGPTPLQRAQANSAAKYHNKYPPIAVVTGSILHRGIVTVFSWMQKGNVVAYSPPQLSAAMDYAGIGATSRVKALSRVHELARRVGSSWIQDSVRL